MTGTDTVVLQPGGDAKILTQSAGGADNPTLIINGSGARAYVGGDYSVSPANATPLDPGTSLPWTTKGQIWAVADPAATAPVTLRATADIDSWSPSPVAIAAATAAELLATGVPNVLISDLLFDDTVGAGGTSTVIDASRYSSLLISAVQGAALKVTQSNAPDSFVSAAVASDTFVTPTRFPGLIPPPRSTVLVRAVGRYLIIDNSSASTVRFRVFGTNRETRYRVDSRAGMGTDRWSCPAQAFAANAAVTFDHETPEITVQGECYLSAVLGATSTVSSAQVIMFDASGSPSGTFVADTKEPAAYVSANNQLHIAKRIVVPPGATFAYVPRVAATTAPYLRLVPVDP